MATCFQCHGAGRVVIKRAGIDAACPLCAGAGTVDDAVAEAKAARVLEAARPPAEAFAAARVQARARRTKGGT